MIEDFVRAFAFWALIELLGLLFLVFTVKGIAIWEKSRNRSVRYAYLIGIGFLLDTLVLDTMLLVYRRKSTIPLWDWTYMGWPQWYMPIFWVYIAILASAVLVCLYISNLTKSPAEEPTNIASQEIQRTMTLLGSLAGIITLCVTVIVITAVSSYLTPAFVLESIYLWSRVGILVLSFLFIITGVARLQRGKKWPIEISYLVGLGYLVLITFQSFEMLEVRRDLLHISAFRLLTHAERWLSHRSLYIPTFCIIFATIVGCYLLFLIIRRSSSIGSLWEGLKRHRGWFRNETNQETAEVQ